MNNLYETSGSSPPSHSSDTTAPAPALSKGHQHVTTACEHPSTRPVLGGRLCLVCGKYLEGGR